MNSISRFKTLDLIKNNNFVECNFIKKDGTHRNIKCSFEENQNNSSSMVLVYDIEKDGYRNVNLDTLLSIKVKDTVYKVI
ncbi:SH3 beta-barrel fold-containing protein [Sulfurimonas sp.]